MTLYIGCAGWNLRKNVAEHFPVEGTHLQRYAARLNCVEINSSFYQSHRKTTYERWCEATPANFRFSVKIPKRITHLKRLIGVDREAQQFLDETSGLGSKLGPILVQLPPTFQFDVLIAEPFFRLLRQRVRTPIVCEPRHLSWFASEAESLMTEHHIDRVAADPSIGPVTGAQRRCQGTYYCRWHGSPRMHYSAYDGHSLRAFANMALAKADETQDVWCIFDNTALGAAWINALTLAKMLKPIARVDSRLSC